jgi:hypothetical protein
LRCFSAIMWSGALMSFSIVWTCYELCNFRDKSCLMVSSTNYCSEIEIII